MSEQFPTLIVYTKGAVQYVTTPEMETHFLNWLNESGGGMAGYTRETTRMVGWPCAPKQVHTTEKRDATVLTLVQKNEK